MVLWHLIVRVRSRAAALHEEDGIALVMAVSMVAVLTIAIAGTLALVQGNETVSGRDRQSQRAFNIAEAGLNYALSSLASSSTVPSSSFSLDGGSGTYSGTQSGSTWTITGTGTSPDGRITRQLTLQATLTASPPSSVWGYGFFMGDPAAPCTTFDNSATIQVSVYVASCLNMSGDVHMVEPGAGSTLTLYVGGPAPPGSAGLNMGDKGSSSVGTSSQPIASATIVGGCRFHTQNYICSNAASSQVWASSYSSTAQSLSKPTIDPVGVYASARPGPQTPCSAGSTPGSLRFDTGDSLRNTSLGTVRLLALGAFDCRVYDAGGSLVGQLTWVPATKALTVQGTIFIDGNLQFTGNDEAVYQGNGTIYANGTVSFSNGAHLCGAPSTFSNGCSGAWDPSQHSLVIVAVNAGNAASGWSMSGDGKFEGGAYVVGKYTASNGTFVEGPVIADWGQLQGDPLFKPLPTLPPGAPGAGGPPTMQVVAGSWQQLQ